MGYSTGTTLGKGISEYLAKQGNQFHCEDFEKLKKFLNEETGFRFSFGSHDAHKLTIKAVCRCNLR